MPYRYLPNSDQQRLAALTRALAKLRESNNQDPADPTGKPILSTPTVTALQTLAPRFEQEMRERGEALAQQSQIVSALRRQLDRLGQLCSHFIQVFNLGIARGTFRAAERAHYQLDIGSEELPPLRTREEILQTARNLIHGETTRRANAPAPEASPAMALPSAGEIENLYEEILSLLGPQTQAKDSYDREQEDVEALRPTADDLIRDIWDEVEFHHRRDTPASKRRKAREWGVAYRLRPGEPTPPDEPDLTEEGEEATEPAQPNPTDPSPAP